MPAKLSIVFAGTPAFAVPALEAIAATRHLVRAVFTQPDRRAGRGLRIEPSPVKRAALAHSLPVEQPATFRDADSVALLAGYEPDVLVVVAYGLLLPQAALDIPRLGCLNIHASLLPRWRGAAPIQRALLAGDAETGVTIMRMEAGLDTGPALSRRAIRIEAADTGGSLHDKLAALGASMIVEALELLASGQAVFEPQDAAAATYARKIAKDEARIDWSRPAAEIERVVRAFNPWPVAETRLDGAQLRVWQSHVVPAPGGRLAVPGEILEAEPERLVVATGRDSLALERVQLAGRRPVSAPEFIRGRALAGKVLDPEPRS